MGFFDDVAGVLDGIGTATKDVGGVVLDAASTVNSWGNSATGGALGELEHPVADVLGGAAYALQQGYEYSVDRPTSSLFQMLHHATIVAQNQGFGASVSDLFTNGSDWAKAWDQSKNYSLGQAATEAFADDLGNSSPKYDPITMGAQQAYAAAVHGHESLAGVSSTALDLSVGFKADPTVKGLQLTGDLQRIGTAGVLTNAAQYAQRFGVSTERANQWAERILNSNLSMGRGEMTAAQRASLPNLLDPTNSSYALNRMDGWLDRINGQTSGLRPLTADEIQKYTPQLTTKTADGGKIAALLVDARNLSSDYEQVKQAQRTILGVALGDSTAVEKIRAQVQNGQHIADQLNNMLAGSTLNVEGIAANPILSANPIFAQEAERQLDNLNHSGDISRLVQNVQDRWTEIAGTGKADDVTNQIGIQGLSAIPGVTQHGERVLARNGVIDEAGQGRRSFGGDVASLSRGSKAMAAPGVAADRLDQWQSKWADRGGTASTIFQNGSYSMPLVMAKGLEMGANAAAWGVNKAVNAPFKLANSARIVHFTGLANLNDWNYAKQQLETQMVLSHMPYETRNALMSEAHGAFGESAKLGVIEKIEHASMQSIADHYNDLNPDQYIDKGYVAKIFQNHMLERRSKWAQMVGRQYAATTMDDEGRALMQSRADAIDNAMTTERKATLASKKNIYAKWDATKPYTVDMIMDGDGMPYHFPLLPSQLGNTVPLANMQLFDMQMKRDQGFFHRLSRTWADADSTVQEITSGRRVIGQKLQALAARSDRIKDAAEMAGQRLTNMWKWGTLFRLGYPIRFLMDDDMRVATYLGSAATTKLVAQGFKNLVSNEGHRLPFSASIGDLGGITRRQQLAMQLMAGDAKDAGFLEDHLNDSDWSRGYQQRLDEIKSVQRSLKGHQARIGRLNNSLDSGELTAEQHATKTADQSAKMQSKLAYLQDLQDQIGDVGGQLRPELAGASLEDLQNELDAIHTRLKRGAKGYIADVPKQRLGQTPIYTTDGTELPAAYADPMNVYQEKVKMNPHLDSAMRDIPDSASGGYVSGSYRTILPTEDHHLNAWANTLNWQLRNDPVARFFIDGGDANAFGRWLKEPEQAVLRRRMATRATTPDSIQQWGHSVEQMVHDYIPNETLQKVLQQRDVKPAELEGMFPDARQRPPVHAASAADTLGSSVRARAVDRFMNKTLAWLSDAPTDQLSRHPFFVGMYRVHANEAYDALKAQREALGRTITPDDIAEISQTARKQALNDVKTTLFDMSAHCHLAHTLRFVSPFYAAHQMVLSRWFRVGIQEHPEFIRRWTMPIYQGLENAGMLVDANGQPLKHGDPVNIGTSSVLLQQPAAWGGPDPRSQQGWKFALNAANVVMPNGLNPGVGPVVQVPMEWLATKMGDAHFAQLAKVFDPYPTGNPADSILPSWVKNLGGVIQGETGINVPFINNANRFTEAYNQAVMDANIRFVINNGREPNADERAGILSYAEKQAQGAMVTRFAASMLAPVSVQPGSRYAALQNGFNLIREQVMQLPQFAKNPQAAYDEISRQFMAKWGDILAQLMPSGLTPSQEGDRVESVKSLFESGVYANPAHIQPTSAEQQAVMKYQGLLKNLDPSLTRLVTGPYADAIAAQDPLQGQTSPYASAWFKNQPMQNGYAADYLSAKDPGAAMLQREISDGWDKYSQLTAWLTNQAESMGAQGNWRSVPQLEAIKKQAVASLEQQNQAWAQAYQGSGNQPWDTLAGFNGLVDQMKRIATYAPLVHDSARGDIKVLSQFLQLRDYVSELLQQRQAQGLGSYTSQNQADILDYYGRAVAQLEVSNPDFQQYAFNGVIEHDPYLRAAENRDQAIQQQIVAGAQ